MELTVISLRGKYTRQVALHSQVQEDGGDPGCVVRSSEDSLEAKLPSVVLSLTGERAPQHLCV